MKRQRNLIIFGSVSVVSLLALTFFWHQKLTEHYGVVEGTVMLGPSCPVLRNPPDPQCVDKPYATTLDLIIDNQDGVVDEHPHLAKEFNSGTDGTFKVQISPGVYKISSTTTNNGTPASGQPYCSSSQSFTVTANQLTKVSVSCDTGIR